MIKQLAVATLISTSTLLGHSQQPNKNNLGYGTQFQLQIKNKAKHKIISNQFRAYTPLTISNRFRLGRTLANYIQVGLEARIKVDNQDDKLEAGAYFRFKAPLTKQVVFMMSTSATYTTNDNFSFRERVQLDYLITPKTTVGIRLRAKSNTDLQLNVKKTTFQGIDFHVQKNITKQWKVGLTYRYNTPYENNHKQQLFLRANYTIKR